MVVSEYLNSAICSGTYSQISECEKVSSTLKDEDKFAGFNI